MLSTVAFFVTGLAVLICALAGRRTTRMTVDAAVLSRDLGSFMVIYALAVAVSLLPACMDRVCPGSHHDLFGPLRIAMAVVLVAAYVFYLKRTIAGDSPQLEEPRALHFAKARFLRIRAVPLAAIQLLVSLAIMVAGAELFVVHVRAVSTALHVPPLVLSLIITPIATELPEKFNSVIWIARRRDSLAVGNITGAMVFQSSFPVMIGILFTDWDLLSGGAAPLVSALLALAASAMVLVWVKVKRSLSPYLLIACGLFYGVFIAYVAMR